VREVRGPTIGCHTIMRRSNTTACYYKVIFTDKPSACFDSEIDSKTMRCNGTLG